MLKQALLATSATFLMVLSPVIHADFFNGIRDLKNAVSDVTSGTKEVSSLKNDLGLGGNKEEQDATLSEELATGDVLAPKINKLKVFADPSKEASTVSELNKTNDIIFMGEEVDGFYFITTDEGAEGWVQKILVSKR